MEIKIKSYSSQSSLISSIMFFILGAIIYSSADKLLNIISIFIGTIIAIISTISLIIYFFQYKNSDTKPKTGNLIFGIITFILAFIFIFLAEETIRLAVGAWILLTGILRLINVLSMSKKDAKFIQLLIVSSLLIFIGIYTILVEFVGFYIIGIIMMIYAGIEIIGYILYSKNNNKEEYKEGETTLLVPENITNTNTDKKDITIKDFKEKKKKERKRKTKKEK